MTRGLHRDEATDRDVVCRHCGIESGAGYAPPTSLCEVDGKIVAGGHVWDPAE